MWASPGQARPGQARQLASQEAIWTPKRPFGDPGGYLEAHFWYVKLDLKMDPKSDLQSDPQIDPQIDPK